MKSKTARGAEMRHLEAPKPESIAELLRSAGSSDTAIYHAMGARQQSDPESMAAFVYSFEWHPDIAKCLGISSSAYTLLFCREHGYFGHIKDIEARIQRPKAEKGRLKIPQLVWMPLARRWKRDCRLLRASLYDGSVLRKKPVQWTRDPATNRSVRELCKDLSKELGYVFTEGEMFPPGSGNHGVTHQLNHLRNAIELGGMDRALSRGYIK